MTPTNPDNNKPFIYRICDALGITHLVVAVQHSHLMSEITGLIDALAGKANAQHGHDTIGEGNSSISVSNGEISIELNDGESGGEVDITIASLQNLLRALTNPDSTPTLNSDNLVTSGGVREAIDALAGQLSYVSYLYNELPINLSSFGNGKNYICYIDNGHNNPAKNLNEFFVGGTISDATLLMNSNPEIPSNGKCCVIVHRSNQNFIILYQGSMTTYSPASTTQE